MVGRKSKPHEEQESVGQRLRHWRKQASMTLMDLSKKIDISQSALSELENDNSLPSAVTLTNFCKKTGLDVCWLLTGEKRSPSPYSSSSTEDRFKVNEEIIPDVQDPKLKGLIERLVRIYQSADLDKKALIEGLLIGADPGKTL